MNHVIGYAIAITMPILFYLYILYRGDKPVI